MNNLVSVIIPCYNCTNTIQETIESVQKQTYSNIEILAINDGSLDKTESTLDLLALKYDNLTVFNIQNSGQSAARNFGAKKAQGHYFLFLDSDDTIEATYLKKAISFFNINKKLKIVYSKSLLFGSLNEKWNLPLFKMSDFLLENCIHVSALHRATTFKKAGGFDEKLSFYEDWDLWIRIISSEEEVYQIPEFLFNYRKHEDNSSISDLNNNNLTLLSRNRLSIFLKHLELYEKNDLSFERICQNSQKFRALHKKHYNIWYKKYFYKIFKPTKYKKIQKKTN